MFLWAYELKSTQKALKPHNGDPDLVLPRSKALTEVERLRLLVAKIKSWYRQGIHYWLRKDFEVLEEPKAKQLIDFLRRSMGINHSDLLQMKIISGTT